jgi:hypothetical protein
MFFPPPNTQTAQPIYKPHSKQPNSPPFSIDFKAELKRKCCSRKTILKSVSSHAAEDEYALGVNQQANTFSKLVQDYPTVTPIHTVRPYCPKQQISISDNQNRNVNRFQQPANYLERVSKQTATRRYDEEVCEEFGVNECELKLLKDPEDRLYIPSQENIMFGPCCIEPVFVTPSILTNTYLDPMLQPMNSWLPFISLDTGLSPMTLTAPGSILVNPHQQRVCHVQARQAEVQNKKRADRICMDQRECKDPIAIMRRPQLNSPHDFLNQEKVNCDGESKSVMAKGQKVVKITKKERRIKVKRYLEKKKRRNWNKQILYRLRRDVAQKRPRIRGRFVTKEQAYGTLGVTPKDLSGNQYSKTEVIKTLIVNKDDPIVSEMKDLKIGNIKNLITIPKERITKNKGELAEDNKEDNPSSNKTLVTEFNTIKNIRDNVIEIRIDKALRDDLSKSIQGKN